MRHAAASHCRPRSRPMKSKLFMVKEEEDGDEFLVQSAEHWPFQRPAKKAEVTSAAIAEMLDHDAENKNRHDFVGVYSWLAKAIVSEAGESAACRILGQIVDLGGLENV